MQLQDQALFHDKAFLAGEWVSNGRTFPVHNPATGEVVAEVPRLGQAETRRAIEAADRAFGPWRSLAAKKRHDVLQRWGDLMLQHADDLATIMTTEQGKPLAEAKGEIVYGASFLHWFAEEARRLYGDTIPSPTPKTRTVVIKQPVGVTAGITPWNFPAAMITRKAAPALAAGCPMVVKPAEQTPLSALALCELAKRAGVPDGVLSVVTGDAEDAPEIGRELTTNPTVRKIGFTGSTEVGKLLMQQAAGTVKKVSLELGGNAPFIVFDDANIDDALKGAMQSKFRNTGQTCVSANRILVQDSIYDQFAERLTESVKGLKVANGLEPGAQIGPLIDQQGLDKASRLVEQARSSGARVLVGGGPHELGQTFYQPTVLTDVDPKMDMSCNEIFGPVAGLIRFRDEAEAIRIANDTPYGLASYFYARDLGRVWRVGEALEYGMVGINVGIISDDAAPFGGVKESGIGREGSRYGLEEWVEVKYLSMGGIA